MENNSQQQPNLDKAEERRTALIVKHSRFLGLADLQGRSIESVLPLLEIADLLKSVLGRILNGKRIC